MPGLYVLWSISRLSLRGLRDSIACRVLVFQNLTWIQSLAPRTVPKICKEVFPEPIISLERHNVRVLPPKPLPPEIAYHWKDRRKKIILISRISLRKEYLYQVLWKKGMWSEVIWICSDWCSLIHWLSFFLSTCSSIILAKLH